MKYMFNYKKQYIAIVVSLILVITSGLPLCAQNLYLAAPGNTEVDSSLVEPDLDIHINSTVPDSSGEKNIQIAKPLRGAGSPAVTFDAIVKLSKGKKPVRKSDIDTYLGISKDRVRQNLDIFVARIEIVKKYGEGKEATYDISYLDKKELRKIQDEFHRHFENIKRGLRDVRSLKTKIDRIRKKYKGKETKDSTIRESDEIKKRKFREFAERKPKVGSKDKAVLRVDLHNVIIVFKNCQLIYLDRYGQITPTTSGEKLVRVVVKRVNEDVITAKIYDVMTGKKVCEEYYIYSYNKKRLKTKQKACFLSLRSHYRAWFANETDVIPIRILELPTGQVTTGEGRYGAYAFSVKPPRKKKFLRAVVPIPKDILRMPNGRYKTKVYGRPLVEAGMKVFYVYLSSKEKKKKKAIGCYGFETPNIFVPIWRKEPKKVPKYGTNSWYRDVVSGEIVAHERVEIQKKVKYYKHQGVNVYLWQDKEKQNFVDVNVGHYFMAGDNVRQYNVLEELTRIEIIKVDPSRPKFVKGEKISSLDATDHWIHLPVPVFFDPNTKRVYTARTELRKRAESYFIDTKSEQVPDPVMINWPTGSATIVVCSINGKESIFHRVAIRDEGLLFVFGKDRKARKSVNVYLLDGFNRPCRKLREGYFDKRKQVIIWDKAIPLTTTGLNQKQKEDLAICMWYLGYAPVPDFVVEFLYYIAQTKGQEKLKKKSQDIILSCLIEKLKVGKKISVERLLTSLSLDIPLREVKEKLVASAKSPGINPHYKAPKEWESIEGMSDEDILERMGINEYIEDSFSSQKSLNAVLLTCQKALLSETYKVANGNRLQAKILLGIRNFGRRARVYGIELENPVWVRRGSQEVMGKNIVLPRSGIAIHQLIEVIRRVYARKALNASRDNEEARKRLGVSIWEFNDILQCLEKPVEAVPKLRGKKIFERHLDAFRRYDENPYGYDILQAKKYFPSAFAGRKILRLAKQLRPHDVDIEVAKTNIALIRALTFFPKESRKLVTKYVLDFYAYKCVAPEVNESLAAAVEDFMEIADVSRTTYIEPFIRWKGSVAFYTLQREAMRKSGFMFFAAEKGSKLTLKYMKEMVGILDQLSTEGVLDIDFLKKIKRKFDEACDRFELFYIRQERIFPHSIQKEIEVLEGRFSSLKKKLSSLGTGAFSGSQAIQKSVEKSH